MKTNVSAITPAHQQNARSYFAGQKNLDRMREEIKDFVSGMLGMVEHYLKDESAIAITLPKGHWYMYMKGREPYADYMDSSRTLTECIFTSDEKPSGLKLHDIQIVYESLPGLMAGLHQLGVLPSMTVYDAAATVRFDE